MKTHAQLIALLLLLLPQIIGWVTLSRATPFLAWVVSTTWHKDQPIALRESGLWYQNGRGAWQEAIRYDLQTMRWEQVPKSNLMRAFELADPPPKAQYWSIDWKSQILKPDEPCTAELIDRATHEVLKTRQLPYPCHLVDYRYAVSIDWYWLDLDDADAEFQKFTGLGTVRAIWRSSPNQSIVVQHDRPLGRGGPAVAQASIVEFRERQGPRVVSTWNVRNCKRDLYVVDLGEDVISIDPEGKQIEVRSKQDGAVRYSEPMPSDVDWKTVEWENFLNMNTLEGPLTYDYKQRTWIEVPPGGKLEMRLEGTGLQLFQVNGKHQIYNATTKKILFETPREDSVRFVDDQTILHIDEQSWVRFHFRSAEDGRILKTYAPFGYVNPCLVILSVLFAVWSMHWMRTSLRAGLWAWIDIVIIIGLPMIWLCYRCLSVGPIWEIERLPFQYLAGCAVAVVSLGLIWLVFGRTRWVLRLIPLMICEAFVLLICRLAFSDRPDLMLRGALTINLPALGILIVLLCLRCVRWRLINLAQKPAQPQSPIGPTRLGDLFLVTVGVALMVAASGSSFSLLKQAEVDIAWQAMIASAIGVTMLMAMMLSGLSSGKRWFELAAFVACILLVVLCAETLDRFPITNRIEFVWQQAGSTRAILSGSVACFVAALPYRLRGYRLMRS